MTHTLGKDVSERVLAKAVEESHNKVTVVH